MERTISVKMNDTVRCCIGDTVTMNVNNVSKLTSYGTQCETSEVPAIIVAASINSDGTYQYVLRYDSCVLLSQCNYLIPNEVTSICCTPSCESCGSYRSNTKTCCETECNLGCNTIIRSTNCG